MFQRHEKLLTQLLIFIGGLLLFLPFLGSVHLFDWDEINFAESAREMIVSGDYLTVQINFQPFWEKPPLFIWFQVLSMKIFGINEFAARFPNAICGIVTLLLLYHIGRKIFNPKFGLLWVLMYACSILPHFYFKSGIIDPWFNLFIFLGVYYCVEYISAIPEYNKKPIIFSAIFIGLAILTKGPVAFLIFILTMLVFLGIKRFKIKFRIKDILIYSGVLAFVGGFWFILQILNGNFSIIIDFIEYQIRLFTTKDAGHGGFLFYHFVILFFGVFPASIFALKAFRKKYQDQPKQVLFIQWMMILFWVVLILFTIVKTKIVHYSSLCYFPLTFLGTYTIYKMLNGEIKWSKWINAILISIASVVFIMIATVQYVGMNAAEVAKSGLIKDRFAVGNLQAQVNWSGFEFLIGLILVGGIVFSILYFKKDRLVYRAIGIFASGLIFTNLTIIALVPRIEQYSQHAAIEFYEKAQHEDCYVETLGFKSYAKYFYFNKPIPSNKNSYNENWLITGDIDKIVYFVCKNVDEADYQKMFPKLKKLYDKNGFVFFVRQPIPK